MGDRSLGADHRGFVGEQFGFEGLRSGCARRPGSIASRVSSPD
jgi:hypothetical protein